MFVSFGKWTVFLSAYIIHFELQTGFFLVFSVALVCVCVCLCVFCVIIFPLFLCLYVCYICFKLLFLVISCYYLLKTCWTKFSRVWQTLVETFIILRMTTSPHRHCHQGSWWNSKWSPSRSCSPKEWETVGGCIPNPSVSFKGRAFGLFNIGIVIVWGQKCENGGGSPKSVLSHKSQWNYVGFRESFPYLCFPLFSVVMSWIWTTVTLWVGGM